MPDLKKILAGMIALTVAGCGLIPNENTDNKPVAIKADSEQYYTCSAFTLGSTSNWGQTTYELSFNDPTRGGGKVELKGVKKLEIIEMPEKVDAPMPTALPDVNNDHDRDGKAYQEGNTYVFTDGSQAQVKNGTWVPVKVPNTICTPNK